MSARYPIGESGQYLLLDKNVLNHFNKWRQLHQATTEAGGQLFGVVEGACINIKLATGPKRSDRRGRFYFSGDRVADRREISILHKSGLHFFGDWHTHPQAIPRPSAIDLASMTNLYMCSKHELHAFLMVIVGTARFPEGLHVSVHEANSWAMLNAEIYSKP